MIEKLDRIFLKDFINMPQTGYMIGYVKPLYKPLRIAICMSTIWRKRNNYQKFLMMMTMLCRLRPKYIFSFY